jgi:hypothetical protein
MKFQIRLITLFSAIKRTNPFTCGSLFLILFCVFSFSCNKKGFQRNEYANLISEHPATDSRNYPLLSNDWSDRSFNIDESRISYVKEMNDLDGFIEIPIPSHLTDEMKKRVKTISLSFRPEVKSLFDKYLYGIYFCEKLGGTGLTGFVYNNSKNKPLGGFIIIDSSVIKKKANDWITFKERSAFQIGDISIQVQIEKEEDNTIDNALRYILLHEMGHILSNTLGITPDLRNQSLDYTRYPFFDKVWISEKESIYDEQVFLFRDKVKFYSPEAEALKLDIVWDQIYPLLSKTHFSTLYGATNALDDFAETFVSYVHCILDKRPWELTLTKNGNTFFKMKNRIYELEREKEFMRKNVFK